MIEGKAFMKELSAATRLSGSGIRRMFDLSRGMTDVISFILGEPGFDTPKPIVEAAKRALDEGKTHYTDNAGILPLREAICESLVPEGVQYAPDEIMVCTGAMQAIYLTMAVLLNPGDEVLISDPCYANYYGQVAMNYGVPVPVPTYEKDGFCLTRENLLSKLSPKTKAILINSPNNPTGAVYSRESLGEIADLCREYDLYLIYDAVYKHLVYDGAEFVNIAAMEGMRERTIYIDSFSKTYAMTGWRLGYLAGPREIVSLMPKLQEFMPSCISTFTQYAGIEALRACEQDIARMRSAYEDSRRVLLERIRAIPGLACSSPNGAFYAFVNIAQSGMTSQDFAEQLLRRQRVVLAPGTAFGRMGEGYVRISYATDPDSISRGMDRLDRFMRSL